MHSLALYKSPKAVFVVYFCDSISEKTTCGGKDSFWFTVLEMSAHGHLAPLLLGLGTGRQSSTTGHSMCKAAQLDGDCRKRQAR